MIARIAGQVVEKEDKSLVIDVGGIGYRVAALASVRDKAIAGDDIVLQIYHHRTSDIEALYGFGNTQELQVFKLLLTVPSVGPKTAMGILEAAPMQILQRAVAENDKSLLTKVSGVGKRTAERIVLELKGKLQQSEDAAEQGSSLQHETVEALISIGFSPTQARTSASSLPSDIATVEEAVKTALQRSSRV